eukprot:SAG31_NODE_18578_length_631_cov_0.631579_1_plen_154_part_00
MLSRRRVVALIVSAEHEPFLKHAAQPVSPPLLYLPEGINGYAVFDSKSCQKMHPVSGHSVSQPEPTHCTKCPALATAGYPKLAKSIVIAPVPATQLSSSGFPPLKATAAGALQETESLVAGYGIVIIAGRPANEAAVRKRERQVDGRRSQVQL